MPSPFLSVSELASLFRYWQRHLLASRDLPGTVACFLRWQLGSRLLRMPVLVPWVGSTSLVIETGMTGATMNFYCGLHEAANTDFVLHALRPGDVFLDVGANVDTHTILASGVAQARTIALEPIPATFLRLLRNLRLNNLLSYVEPPVWRWEIRRGRCASPPDATPPTAPFPSSPLPARNPPWRCRLPASIICCRRPALRRWCGRWMWRATNPKCCAVPPLPCSSHTCAPCSGSRHPRPAAHHGRGRLLPLQLSPLQPHAQPSIRSRLLRRPQPALDPRPPLRAGAPPFGAAGAGERAGAVGIDALPCVLSSQPCRYPLRHWF
jgi:hypothetical protein